MCGALGQRAEKDQWCNSPGFVRLVCDSLPLVKPLAFLFIYLICHKIISDADVIVSTHTHVYIYTHVLIYIYIYIVKNIGRYLHSEVSS